MAIPKKTYVVISIFIISIGVLIGSIIFNNRFSQQSSFNANVTSLPTQTQSPTQTKTLTTPVATNTNSASKFNHIFLYVLENHSKDQIIGSSSAPTLTNLANKYVTISNYQNILHPSLPNYIALTSGSNYGITTDCESCYINVKNIGSLMSQNNITWKGYMESMPTPCFIGSAYPYAQKHDPFIYYDDIRTSQICKNNVVPYSNLSNDINTNKVPQFSFITPNLCNDMHDCSVQTGDTWMKNSLNMVMNSNAYKDKGLIIITFDESESSGSIPGILISQNIKKGNYTNPVTHYSILKLIENNFNLPYLGNSASATDIISNL